MTDYIRRVLDDELDQLIPALPAIAIDGPKGVGETTTVLQRAESVFQLDDPATLELVMADPRRMIEAPEPVVIDEWQRYEQSWDLVRRAVDADGRPGR
ncbi:MAG: AAA family ATPase, partial [Acidimicrobiales bacterium]